MIKKNYIFDFSQGICDDFLHFKFQICYMVLNIIHILLNRTYVKKSKKTKYIHLKILGYSKVLNTWEYLYCDFYDFYDFKESYESISPIVKVHM